MSDLDGERAFDLITERMLDLNSRLDAACRERDEARGVKYELERQVRSFESRIDLMCALEETTVSPSGETAWDRLLSMARNEDETWGGNSRPANIGWALDDILAAISPPPPQERSMTRETGETGDGGAGALDLYPMIRKTNSAVFGFRGSVLDATDCPLGHGVCAPERGESCPEFMGHLFRGDAAFLGQVVPVCCAVLLRALLAARTEGQPS